MVRFDRAGGSDDSVQSFRTERTKAMTNQQRKHLEHIDTVWGRLVEFHLNMGHVDAIRAVLAEHAEMLAMLKRLEWSDVLSDAGFCPECGGGKPGDHPNLKMAFTMNGHNEGCGLGDLIRKAEKGST
jgi:hypothetical protein